MPPRRRRGSPGPGRASPRRPAPLRAATRARRSRPRPRRGRRARAATRAGGRRAATSTSGRAASSGGRRSPSCRRIVSAPSSSPRPWSASPAAIVGSGRSSTTSGSAPTAGSPSTRSARRAASAPASRSVERPRRGPRGELGDAARRLGQPLLGEPSLAHGRDDRRVDALDLLGRQVGAEAERVGARGQRAHGRVLDSLGRRRRPASRARRSSRRRRSRAPSRSSSTTAEFQVAGSSPKASKRMCAVITARTPGLDRGGERRQGALAQDVEARVGGRQLQVRVGDRLAVAGEVLGAGGDADALQALDEGRDLARDELRVGAERADADDRARRVDAARRRPARGRGRSRPRPARRRSPRRRAASGPASSTAPSARFPGTSSRSRPRAA